MLDRRSRIRRLLESYPWLIMATFIVGFAVLGLAMVRIDQELRLDPLPSRLWLYSGSPDAAMSVLSAIASSAITVAGVVFSATFVTMQLASSQYTPRVVKALSRLWYLHVVLGMFLGSFTFSLLVLRSVRPPEGDPEAAFTPVLSVSLAIVIAIASVGVLGFYAIYGMRTLEPTFLINSAADQTRSLLRRSLIASRKARSVGSLDTDPPPEAMVVAIRAPCAGFLQMMHFEQLLAVAIRNDVTINVTANIGNYIFPGENLAIAWPGERISEEAMKEILKALLIGDERTSEQDIEFGFRRVADIMLKAISAAINDPTTAEYCMNTLGDLIIMVANEPEPQRYLVDKADTVRVIWEPEPYDRCVHTAFDQLRFYVKNDTHLAIHALKTLRRVHALVPVSAQPVIESVASVFHRTASAHLDTDEDRRAFERASAWFSSSPPESA